jgi:hypothetical protein
MRNGVVGALGALLLGAIPCAAVAGTEHAPPTLTPLVAVAVNAACPGAERYTIGLTRGISDAEAAAATRFFTACQRATRRDLLVWKNEVASVALGAADLSRGVLDHDPSALKQAVDATADLRSRSGASDDAIRGWKIIPDEFDVRRHAAVFRTDCYPATWVTDAAYINIAAHAGTAWISEPREPAACPDGLILPAQWSPFDGVGAARGTLAGSDSGMNNSAPGSQFPRPEPP